MRIVIAILTALSAHIAAEAAPLDQILKARKLYACANFFRAGSEASVDSSQKEKLKRIGDNFLIHASANALAIYPGDPGGPTLAESIGNSGKKDFEQLMQKVEVLSTPSQKNELMGQFAESCSKALDK